jgi:hypothetical protein
MAQTFPSAPERMFESVTTPPPLIDEVLRLKGLGFTDRSVSARTGVPVATIRVWRRRGIPGTTRRGTKGDRCPRCGGVPHIWDELPADTYAYLLGVYLGDGHLRHWGGGWTLRVTLDVGYPLIIEECAGAIETLRGVAPRPRPHHSGSKCINLDSGWRSWPCLLPQHGRGRKHTRAIELHAWQQQIVERHAGSFLRGLIHTDGWRGVNRVHVKGRDYEYPRYQFSNRSDDIRRLFCEACDQLAVEWRPWTQFHISVARRDSVAILDRHVGLKQ